MIIYMVRSVYVVVYLVLNVNDVIFSKIIISLNKPANSDISRVFPLILHSFRFFYNKRIVWCLKIQFECLW